MKQTKFYTPYWQKIASQLYKNPDGLHVTQINHMLNATYSQTSMILQAMCSVGLVTRTKPKHNQRITVYQASEKGKPICEACYLIELFSQNVNKRKQK